MISARRAEVLGLPLALWLLVGPAEIPAAVAPPPAPIVAATPTPTPSCVVTPADMVAWWPLDEGAGAASVADIGLPPPNNGVPQPGPVVASPPGGPMTVAGNLNTAPPDRALFFYDPAVRVEVPPAADLDLAASDVTIDGWIVVGPAPSASWTASTNRVALLTVVDKLDPATNTGFGFYVRLESICPTCPPPPQSVTMPAASTTEVRLVFVLGDGTGLLTYASAPVYAGTGTVFPFPTPPSPLTPPPPGWMHVAAAIGRAQNVGRFYFNGVHLATSDFTPVIGVNNAAPLWLGGTRLQAMFALTEFTLNEIEVFDAALLASEIQAIGGSLAGKCKPPLDVTPTPTPTPVACVGDCNGDGVVTVNEIILMVNIALGTLPLSACPAGDPDHSGTITINELIAAVNNALNGCACDFIAPHLCGGTCPNPADVCRPLPDDSGCACQPVEPVGTPTATPSLTPTRPPTQTPRATPTSTESPTATLTATPSATPTRPPTQTATPTPSATPTVTSTSLPTPCCPEPVSLDISTGQAAIGQDDPLWRLIAAPAGTTGGPGPRPAVVIAANSAWAALPGTQWVSANAQCTNTITPDCPGGLYSYELCWSQCDGLQGQLGFDLLADNSATVFLNGTPIGATTGGFTTPTSITFSDPGPSGINCLRVDVTNNPHSSGSGTATGMALHGSLTGCVNVVTPCGFVGPRQCGGACPNATDVCQPLPDDTGCACVAPPTLGAPCGRGVASCTYHEHCGIPGTPLVCVDDGISGDPGGGCSDDTDCAIFPALPLCAGTSACGPAQFCYQPCP